MINSKPNNKNYHQGNYIPKNKDKVLKLNNQGGIFYRSSWEQKIITYLDNHPDITAWGSECLKIPYQLTHFDKNGDSDVKGHSYYPDFYYEMKSKDGSTRKVVAEVKPQKEFDLVQGLMNETMSVPPNATLKKLKNFEYDLKMAQKNYEKWKTMIRWCELKGYEFIVITENTLKGKNLL